jgi:hypothetical protein
MRPLREKGSKPQGDKDITRISFRSSILLLGGCDLGVRLMMIAVRSSLLLGAAENSTTAQYKLEMISLGGFLWMREPFLHSLGAELLALLAAHSRIRGGEDDHIAVLGSWRHSGGSESNSPIFPAAGLAHHFRNNQLQEIQKQRPRSGESTHPSGWDAPQQDLGA